MARTLVYKRTHHGDPNEAGHFGCNGCMMSVRGRKFSDVIGIGGIGREPIRAGIAGRVNWVGIGRMKVGSRFGYPVWSFESFRDFGTRGPFVRDCIPLLARQMYDVNVRSAIHFDARTQAQIDAFLRDFLSFPLTDTAGGVPPSTCTGRSSVCRRRPRQRISNGVRICGRRPN